MGYKIIFTSGLPEQTWETDDTITTDLLLSVLIARGSYFQDPSFGLPELPKKITIENIPLVRQRFEQAWQWLIDTGKAKSITVTAEKDDDVLTRVNIRATAVQANDKIITFETFVEVI